MNARSDGRPQLRFRQYPYGVTYRKNRPKKPWLVKFKIKYRDIYVGCYETKEQAKLAADEFLRNEKCHFQAL